jgi:D-lactate dehydrogenase
MWRVKGLLDPANVLNPGVVLNRDPDVHLQNLKVMPEVSPTVDKCIECGYCEPQCPSRDLTLTPRQRIALLREITRLKSLDDPAAAGTAARLQADYHYHGMDTCATDSMCATACPVDIDTGMMVKELRAEEHSGWAKGAAVTVARNFGAAAWMARTGLALLRMSGSTGLKTARAVAGFANRVSKGQVPGLPPDMPLPAPAPRLPHTPAQNPAPPGREVVYYPSCLTRTMGSLPGENAPVGVGDAVVQVLRECGWTARIPAGVSNTCCGQPSARRTVDLLWRATRGGEIPVVCDTSPCTGTMLQGYGKLLAGKHLERWRKLSIMDFPTFMARVVLPTRDDWPRVDRQVVLHPTCTLVKIGASGDLVRIAETFASGVSVPLSAGCCGFAGDRGFLFPELTRSATRPEAQEAVQMGDDANGGSAGYYSTCRTCEIGMSAATGRVYQSVVYLCYDALVGKRRNIAAP